MLYTNGLYFKDDLHTCGSIKMASLIEAPIHLSVVIGIFVGLKEWRRYPG